MGGGKAYYLWVVGGKFDKIFGFVHNGFMDGAMKPNNNLNMEYIMSRTKKNVNVDDRSVSFTYADGGLRVYSLEELTPAMVTRLALHGLAQKLGDSYAGRTDHEDCTEAVWGNLVEENWGATRGSGLEDKLAEAEERLENYIAMDDAGKRMAATLGINRTALEKAIKTIEKAIERRDKA